LAAFLQLIFLVSANKLLAFFLANVLLLGKLKKCVVKKLLRDGWGSK